MANALTHVFGDPGESDEHDEHQNVRADQP